MIEWLSRNCLSPGKDDLAAQLALREVETIFFATAASGTADTVADSLGIDDMEMLVKLVDSYRLVLHNFLGEISSKARMLVQLRSRETLVGWIAYAAAFNAARERWPHVMESYGVSLQPGNLRHLVLSDKLAVNAALKTADYLRFYTKDDAAVFTLVDSGRATFSLAAQGRAQQRRSTKYLESRGKGSYRAPRGALG